MSASYTQMRIFHTSTNGTVVGENMDDLRNEMMELQRQIKTYIRPCRETAWFAEFNVGKDVPPDMTDQQVRARIEDFRRILHELESKLLWGFADSGQMVILAAASAAEARKLADNYWLEGQAITPLATLPLNAPFFAHQRVFKYDGIVWSGDNNFFFEELKSCP